MRNRVSLIAALCLSACMVGPDYQSPVVDLPANWGDSTTAANAPTTISAIPKEWWHLFHDETLAALEEEGLKANADLLTAASNVARARANLQLSDAEQYPELDAKGGATRTAPSKENALAKSGKPYSDLSFSAVLSYEVDLWGKLRRASESARAQLLSQQANRDAIYLAVSSDIATSYFNLLALDAQIHITQQTIAARRATLDYQERQFKEGSVDALTYRNAQAELAAAEAILPALEQSQTVQQNSLAILLGRTPKELVEKSVARGKSLSALPHPPAMPLELPSTLLQRRPDIAAAEQSLVSANAEIGVATAGYFPTLSLSALIGLDSRNLDHLLSGSARNWQLGGGVAAPLIDMGRIDAKVDDAKARKDIALIAYQQAVRSAFADVLDAMSAKRTSDARVAAEIKQVAARAEATRIVKVRYDVGYSTNLERLDAERSLYQAQLDAVAATRDQLIANVTLYKALGGGWAKSVK